MALSKLNLHFSPPQNPPPQLSPTCLRNPSTLILKTQLTIPVLRPNLPLKIINKEEEKESPHHEEYKNPDYLSVAFPSLAFSNTLFFSSAYNFQVVVGDNEPEEKLISRFRRETLKARIYQECKRRRWFESTQDKKKRKAREAGKRNRKRRPTPKKPRKDKADSEKKVQDSDDDNWEVFDVDLPYC